MTLKLIIITKLKSKKIESRLCFLRFGNHPGGYFTLRTLNKLSKDFELIAYSNFDRKDETSEKFKKIFSEWNIIDKMSDEEVVLKIQNDKIHLLIDMQGHSAKNRLFFFTKLHQFRLLGLVKEHLEYLKLIIL